MTLSRLFLSVLAAVTAMPMPAADNKTTVSINATGVPGGRCRWFVEAFPLSPIGESVRRDTLMMTAGRLTYALESDTLFKAYFIPETAATPAGGGETTDQGKLVELYLEPGRTLTVTAELKKDFTAYTVTGSPLAATYAERLNLYRSKHAARLREIENAVFNSIPDSLTRRRLNDEYRQIGEEHRRSDLDYAREHPGEMISAAYYAEQADDSLLAAVAPKMPTAVRQGPFRQLIDERIRVYEIENKVRDNRGSVRIGSTAPAFKVKDIDGHYVTEDMFKGRKFLVLDFWGSWCAWCIRGVPEMKRYREKYRDRLEILGVDCNDKPERMLAAIKKHGMNWLHTVNADHDTEQSLVLKYAVQAFPTKVIISPEGKIAGYFEGEEPEFYKKIDELMK